MGSLLPLSPSLPGSAATRAAAVDSGGAGENDDEKSDEGNSNGGAGGASSLLEDLMGGLSLTGFGASEPNEAVSMERVARIFLHFDGFARVLYQRRICNFGALWEAVRERSLLFPGVSVFFRRCTGHGCLVVPCVSQDALFVYLEYKNWPHRR